METKNQIQTSEALRFESSVNAILKRINIVHGNFRFKYDKNRVMQGERINIHKTRNNDGKGSFPDAEAYDGRKIAVLDSKNHSGTRINIKEINKLLGDGEVRKTKRGILVLQEHGCLSKNAFDKCVDYRVSIVRLTRKEQTNRLISKAKDSSDKEKFDQDYLTIKNMNRIKKALVQQFYKIPTPEILIRKNGWINKKSRAWKIIEKGKDEDLEMKYNLKFEKEKEEGQKNDERRVDKNCQAYKVFKKFMETKNQQYTINYDQTEQSESFKKREIEKKEIKKKNESRDQKEKEEKKSGVDDEETTDDDEEVSYEDEDQKCDNGIFEEKETEIQGEDEGSGGDDSDEFEERNKLTISIQNYKIMIQSIKK